MWDCCVFIVFGFGLKFVALLDDLAVEYERSKVAGTRSY